MLKRLPGLCLPLLLLLAACGADGDPTRPNDFVPLTGITVTAQYPQMAVGTRGQFTATGDFSGLFQRDITSEVTWSAPGTVLDFAATGQPGQAKSVGAGSVDILAVRDGISGVLAAYPVTAAPIQQVTVEPAAASVAAGRAQQFAASGLFGTLPDQFSQDITRDVAWSASPATVATVDTTGAAKGIAAGEATVTATFTHPYGEVPGTAALTVTAPVLDRVEVSPANATLVPGEELQFNAQAFLSDGTELASPTIAWSSNDTAVATIGTTGLAKAVAAGSTTITATVEGVPGTASLIVGTLESIEITAANNATSVAVDGTLQLMATGTYSGGTTHDITSRVTWTSSNSSRAIVSSGGLVTGKDTGNVDITAQEGDLQDTLTLSVTVP